MEAGRVVPVDVPVGMLSVPLLELVWYRDSRFPATWLETVIALLSTPGPGTKFLSQHRHDLPREVMLPVLCRNVNVRLVPDEFWSMAAVATRLCSVHPQWVSRVPESLRAQVWAAVVRANPTGAARVPKAVRDSLANA